MGALVFTYPLLLLALLGLPILWLLIRITPPQAHILFFPPLRLILDLDPEQHVPARSPWWLTVLRLLIAALTISAAAGPLWQQHDPQHTIGHRPLLILFDDGWASAADWPQRLTVTEALMSRAADHHQPVALVAFSNPPQPRMWGASSLAIAQLKTLSPVAFTPDRTSHVSTIMTLAAAQPDCDIVFVSDGLQVTHATTAEPDFLKNLKSQLGPHPFTLIQPDHSLWALKGRQDTNTHLVMDLVRATAGHALALDVVLRDSKERVLGRKAVMLDAALTHTHVELAVPLEVRRDIAKITLENQDHAGAVWLSDSAQNRKRVALISESAAESGTPLLSPLTYLTRALSPDAELRQSRLGTVAAITALLDENPSAFILADSGQLPDQTHRQLKAYMDKGGVVVRFASPSLAMANDPLVPVPLRRGGRLLGGSLSWETPRTLAPFDNTSPFADLTIPADLRVHRQILAEPSTDLSTKVWAHLDDGTPIITADRQGKGWLILFHVSAETSWSNLPLSGLFVSLLQKILALSDPALQSTLAQTGLAQTGAPGSPASLQEIAYPPLRILDGYGRWAAKTDSALPLDPKTTLLASRSHPAGFYGPADAPHALNSLSADSIVLPLKSSGLDIQHLSLATPQPFDLRPWLFGLVLVFFICDALAIVMMQGGLSRPNRSALILLIGFAYGMASPSSTLAASFSDKDRDSALATRLAYVITGNPVVDDLSRLGLTELSAFLSARTALEPSAPVGINPAQDELGVYPLIYWPMLATQNTPPPSTLARIDAYMKNGGTLIFDTRDAGLQTSRGTPTAETKALQAILSQMAIPPLEPIPPQHVLLKTFFLLETFPGRYTTGRTFVESVAKEEGATLSPRNGDGVSSVIITSNDWAAAWAATQNEAGLSLLNPTMARQREMALRGGANIVMYVLTGNYKSDQVHVPALLERMGR